MMLQLISVFPALFVVCLSAPNCDQGALDICTNKPEVLVFTQTKRIPEDENGLQQNCKIQMESYNCSKEIVDRCFVGIKKGVIALVLESMKNEVEARCDLRSKSHADYLEHSPCINSVGDEVHKCARWAIDGIGYVANNIPPKQQVNTLCCYLPQFVGCIRNAVETKCGKAAARYAQGFLETYTGDAVDFACDRRKDTTCLNGAEIPGPEEFDTAQDPPPVISSILLILDSLLTRRS